MTARGKANLCTDNVIDTDKVNALSGLSPTIKPWWERKKKRWISIKRWDVATTIFLPRWVQRTEQCIYIYRPTLMSHQKWLYWCSWVDHWDQWVINEGHALLLAGQSGLWSNVLNVLHRPKPVGDHCTKGLKGMVSEQKHWSDNPLVTSSSCLPIKRGGLLGSSIINMVIRVCQWQAGQFLSVQRSWQPLSAEGSLASHSKV